MPISTQSFLVFAIGARGTGKTYRLFWDFAEKDTSEVVIWIDAACQFSGNTSYPSLPDAKKLPLSYRILKRYPHLMRVETVEDGISLAMEISKKASVSLYLDEYDLAVRNRSIKAKYRELEEILNRGRHLGISFFCAARQMQQVDTVMLSTFDLALFFRTPSIHDLNFAAKNMHGVDKISSDIQHLGNGECFAVYPDGKVKKYSKNKEIVFF